MTVIATFHFPDFPMVLSDMLLSGPERPKANSSLPVVGDVRSVFPDGSGWTITGLVQKTAIVSDNCIVAWAGSRLGAQVAIGSLRELAQTTPLNAEVVRKFMADLPVDTVRLGISLIGFVKDESGFTRIAHEPDLEMKLSDGTPVCLAGTGAASLGRFLATSQRDRIRGSDTNVHPAQLAYELGLQTAGVHLRMENANDEQLLQFFGGFYEIAVWNGERFTKDRGVTYILWEGAEPSRNGFARPSLVITTNYVDDVLLLKSQPFIWTTNDKFEIGRIQLHVSSPVYEPAKLDRPPVPKDIDQRTPWLCHCILARQRDGRVRRLAIADRPKYDGSDLVTLDVKEGVVLAVNWKKQFWIDLQQAIEGPMPRNSPSGDA